ncbi:porin family protein [Dysgonomonas sp. 511]|uniref:porin family protein n=1 Tax=Dysgonomonas sp. 511 TaxID=2302930 RepID=UPI0013D81DEA|nr:porin family protein [Dysgonomonas sp. 511]NDV77955.1 PorT family protein [Dysgonomonas sp. 511]
MKTTTKFGLTALFFLLTLCSINAQKYYRYINDERKFEFGVRGGFNFSRVNNFERAPLSRPKDKYIGHADNVRNKIGFNLGLTFDYHLSKKVYLHSALDFLNKGAKFDYVDDKAIEDRLVRFDDSRLVMMTLQVPIHVGFKIKLSDPFQLSIHGGPYFAYGISGKLERGETMAKWTAGGEYVEMPLNEWATIEKGIAREAETYHDTKGFRRFDFGLGLGILLEHESRVNLGFNYDFGMLDISRQGDKVKTGSGFIFVGYKF